MGGEAAGITNPALGTGLSGLTGQGFLERAIPVAVGIVLTVGVVVFFFMLILGAIQWMSSSGDKQALETAQGRVRNAIVGLFVLFTVYVVVTFFETLFNINILQIDISSLKIV